MPRRRLDVAFITLAAVLVAAAATTAKPRRILVSSPSIGPLALGP